MESNINVDMEELARTVESNGGVYAAVRVFEDHVYPDLCKLRLVNHTLGTLGESLKAYTLTGEPITEEELYGAECVIGEVVDRLHSFGRIMDVILKAEKGNGEGDPALQGDPDVQERLDEIFTEAE